MAGQFGQRRFGHRRSIRFTAGVAVLAVTMGLTACGSGTKTAKPNDTTPTTSGTTQPVLKTLGTGVTKTTVKIGVGLVDFDAIKDVPEVTQVRLQQEQIYQAYIDYINAHGGVAGRKLVAVYEKYIPIDSSSTQTVCTKFTDDDKVFAVTGTFYDSTGASQLCVAKQHHTVLLTFDVDKAMIDKATPGLLVTPATTPQRAVKVLIELLDKRHTFDGKKVAVLGQVKSSQIVNDSIVPDLKAAGVSLGTTGLLNIQGLDTSQPEAQLDSFIEKWKQENISIIFMSSYEATAQRFVQKLRKAMPNVQLLADNTQFLGYGQGAKREHITPKPYEGVLAASGPLHSQYEVSDNWKYCKDIYKQQTGKTAPGPDTIIPYKGSKTKTIDTYGVINDACQLLSMFVDIGNRVGPWLNNTNWINTVNHFGHIPNRGTGPYSSLGIGKYDADDNFQLVQFDSSLPPDGNFKAITKLEDVSS